MAIYSVKGYIAHKSEIQTGTSKSGSEWQKMTVVIERDDEQYDKHIALTVFGSDRIDSVNKVRKGEHVEVSFTVNAREYNGKWYNDISFYGVKSLDEAKPAPNAQKPAEKRADTLDPNEVADLPF